MYLVDTQIILLLLVIPASTNGQWGKSMIIVMQEVSSVSFAVSDPRHPGILHSGLATAWSSAVSNPCFYQWGKSLI